MNSDVGDIYYIHDVGVIKESALIILDDQNSVVFNSNTPWSGANGKYITVYQTSKCLSHPCHWVLDGF